eukprot:8073759-Lingulodinium_polyedra.AAC.1
MACARYLREASATWLRRAGSEADTPCHAQQRIRTCPHARHALCAHGNALGTPICTTNCSRDP